MKLLLILLAIYLPSVVIADIIPARDNVEIRLGRGVDIIAEKPLNECIEYDGGYEREDPAAGNASNQNSSRNLGIQIEHITNYQQYDDFTHQSVSANISYKIYSGSYNYDGTFMSKMQSDQVAVGIKAFADYGRSYLKNVRLKDEYLQLYKNEPVKFFELCGDQYISGFREGQGIYVMMSTATSVNESYSRVSQAISASVGSGKLKANFSASFLDIAVSLLRFGSLKIDVRIVGGSSIQTLSKLVSTDRDVESFTQKIATIMEGMQRDSAQRYVYLTSSYPDIPNQSSSILRQIQNSTLKILFADYRRLMDTLVRIRTVLRGSGDFSLPIGGFSNICMEYPERCKEYLEFMEQRENQIHLTLNKVDKLASQCANATKPKQCRTLSASEMNLDGLTMMNWPNQFKYLLYQQWLDSYINQ